MVMSSGAYGRRRLFLSVACVRNSGYRELVFLKSCSEGEGLSIIGFLRVYFLVRVVCFLVLGSGTLGPA